MESPWYNDLNDIGSSSHPNLLYMSTPYIIMYKSELE